MSKDGVLIGIAEDGSSNPGTIAQADILYRYTAYFYDCYARPVQTVTLYPDRTVFTASTKYNYTDLPTKQVARLQVPQGTASSTDTLNVVLTETFTYDKRGRMLTSNATVQTFNSFVQNNTLIFSDTISSAASATYTYDELGHLTGKTLGGNLTQTLAYNIQDWMTTMQTKKGTANIFSQTLRYYSPAKPNTTALYSGNISEWESVQGTNTASTYGFTYDTQGRLTNSNRYDGTSTTVSQLYTERDISYDRNGNILTLKRISNSIPNPLHNFTYSYDGDKLTTLSGSQSGTSFTSAYLYDGNGNMTLDGNQAVRLSYDLNNLVFKTRTVTQQNQETLAGTYAYFADGTKFSLMGADGSGRLYIGPFTLARKEYTDATTGDVSALTILETADAIGSDARFAFAATPQTIIGTDTTYTIAYETLYLIKDHLGSLKTITDSHGNILERNDSYPYGLRTDLGKNYATLPEKYRVRMPASFSDFSHNGNAYPSVSSPAGKMMPYRLLYNGKELQLVAQTRLVDYGARMLDPVIARWNGMDPMAESLYRNSSFLFCSDNPILLIDYYGLAESTYVKEVGDRTYQVVDAKDDNDCAIYVVDGNNEKTGEIIGYTMTPTDFLTTNDKNGTYNGFVNAIIDLNNLTITASIKDENGFVLKMKNADVNKMVEAISETFRYIRFVNCCVTSPKALLLLAYYSGNEQILDIKYSLGLDYYTPIRYGYSTDGYPIITTLRGVGNLAFGHNLRQCKPLAIPSILFYMGTMPLVGSYNQFKNEGNGYNKGFPFYGEHSYSGSYIFYGYFEDLLTKQ